MAGHGDIFVQGSRAPGMVVETKPVHKYFGLVVSVRVILFGFDVWGYICFLLKITRWQHVRNTSRTVLLVCGSH